MPSLEASALGTSTPVASSSEVTLVECDSDFPGCARTRKSTSGFVGKHCVRARSKTQSVIATSTAEAEFYSMCSAASQAVGLKSLLDNIGETLTIKIGEGATAGKSVASRRGLGRPKHVQVQYLWVQSLVKDGDIVLAMILGDEHESDLMTEHLPAAEQNSLLDKMGQEYLKGQSRLVLEAT